MNCRSHSRSVFQLGFWRNPWLVGGLLVSNVLQAAVVYLPSLQTFFHTVPLPWDEVVTVGLLGSAVLWVDEIRKVLVRRRERREVG